MRKRNALIAITAASALALVGCAGGSGGDNEGAETTELVFSGWGGLVDEVITEVAFEPFTEETGISVLLDSPLSAAKLKSMVDANNTTWDLTMASTVETTKYCDELYEPVDMSNINESDFAEGTITECGIPNNYFSTAMLYDTEAFGGNAPTSLADFFDTEKFPGKRLFPTDAAEYALEFALIADGVTPEELYPLDVDRALAKLDTIKGDLVFWQLGDEQTQAMEAGAVTMAIGWTGRGLQTAQNGGTWDVVWGTHMIGATQLAIPKGTSNFDAAMRLIEFTTAPGPQTLMNEKMAYSAANLNATPQLDELEQHWDPIIGGADTPVAFVPDSQFWADNLEEIQTTYSNWAIG
jgi:putative spermidine/putrescine transport system substrate-binding protein